MAPGCVLCLERVPANFSLSIACNGAIMQHPSEMSPSIYHTRYFGLLLRACNTHGVGRSAGSRPLSMPEQRKPVFGLRRLVMLIRI